jgi:cobyrinic acid a,c-diamide synthase
VSRILVVAGAASGVGKTSITLGVLEAFRSRGLSVQAFKVGPDFIDPGFHALVTGRPSYNLDGWMCGRDEVIRTVAMHGADADLCVVEGVMGLYDGVGGAGDDGSTAQVAKWLRAPVVLVLDTGAQARSAAAVALGFERFDVGVRIAGVIANRVGGDTHARWIAEAVRAACHAPLLGAVPYDAALALPERHLGLVTAAEGPLTADRRRRLGDEVAGRVDLDALWAAAAPLPRVAAPRAGAAAPPRATIGVARDAAFQFYYADNLDRLREAGAAIVFWSPLADADVPDVDGLYIGGGYPEVHARALADNVTLRKAVRRFAEAGRPIYAECGGLMFLADSLVDADGVAHPMAGVLPSRVSMRPPRMSLGYCEVTLTAAAPLGEPGTTARGQEFHFSTLDPVPDSIPRVYELTSPDGRTRREGYLIRRALLSYVHIHFASNPSLARAFVDACAASAA